MTVAEIFSTLSSHMIKGIMIHEHLSNYFDFLSLRGYKRCHEYHYLQETCTHRKLCRYYINHFHKLIAESPIENPKVIPDSWYRYTRQDVDNGTKKTAIKNAFELWKNWEIETKELYEKSYKDLLELGDIGATNLICELIKDVDYELKQVNRKLLELKSIDYDLSIIVPAQTEIHNHYKSKEHKVKKDYD